MKTDDSFFQVIQDRSIDDLKVSSKIIKTNPVYIYI